MTGGKTLVRGVMITAIAIVFGSTCSAFGWGVASAACAVGRYVTAR